MIKKNKNNNILMGKIYKIIFEVVRNYWKANQICVIVS